MTPSAPERVLITGGGGFVGRWLARALVRTGARVSLAGIGEKPAGIEADIAAGAMDWYPMDIRRGDDVDAVLADARPGAIYHLAGISFLPAADQAAAETFDVNVTGAVNLLGAVVSNRQAGGGDPVVLVVGSATQYGAHPLADLPLTEDAVQRPLNVYAASKAAQEIVALQMFRSAAVRVICTRSFNHAGPGRGDDYLLPSLVRRALALKASGGTTFAIGNDTARDYLHVADAAAAYVALAQHGTPGEVYNVCSGTAYRASALARAVMDRVGISAEITSTASLSRSTDIDALIGSPAKLMAATPWKPRFTIPDIVDELVHAAT